MITTKATAIASNTHVAMIGRNLDYIYETRKTQETPFLVYADIIGVCNILLL